MEAGADTGVGNFVGVGPQIGEAMRNARDERARQCNFGDLLGAKYSFDHRCDGGTDNAVLTVIFRMHRRHVERLPSSVTLRGPC